MPLTTKREVILAKIESTYNTDPSPTTSADEILVEDLSWSFEGLRMTERPAVRSSLGMLPQVFGGTLRSVSFNCELKGSGTAGTPPEIDPLLRACGLAVANVPSTSDTYTPASTGHESITIYYYQDGILNVLTGCRGNASFTMEAGAPTKVAFSFTGHSATPTDVSLVTPSYNATIPAPYLSASFTIDSFAGVIGSLSFDLGNQLAMPPDVSESDGYGEISIIGRDINGSFDPELTLVASEAWETNFRNNTLMALAAGAYGSAGNQITITMPEVYYRELSPGDRDGIRTLDIGFGSVDVSTADTDVSIVFT